MQLSSEILRLGGVLRKEIREHILGTPIRTAEFMVISYKCS